MTTENQELNEKNQQLNEKIQELKTQSDNLTQQIQDKETELIQFNVSRAEWSINAYCPIDNRRKCRPCQTGWIQKESSCYAVNDPPSSGQKTWTEAQEICRGKGSDLVIIADETEKSSQKLTGELDAVFRMRRNTQQPTVTFQNPHVSPSAEDYEEVDHVNAAVISENNLPAILDEKRRSLTQALPTIAVSWLILSVILALDIYFTSVTSELLQQFKFKQTALLEENHNLTEHNNRLS
ncbi:hypothetical protein INR49_007031 [Caranx melampygus]|nr:hypothetical protein INR49_007031 [Caranx melampygus]